MMAALIVAAILVLAVAAAAVWRRHKRFRAERSAMQTRIDQLITLNGQLGADNLKVIESWQWWEKHCLESLKQAKMSSEGWQRALELWRDTRAALEKTHALYVEALSQNLKHAEERSQQAAAKLTRHREEQEENYRQLQVVLERIPRRGKAN